MDKIIHYLTIDVLKETVDGKIYVREQGVGHELRVALTAGGKLLELPDSTQGLVQLVFQVPSGTKSDVPMTVENRSMAHASIPRAALSETGVVKCEVRVYTTTAGTYYTTPTFMIDVDGVIYNESAQEAIVSDPTVYETLLALFPALGNPGAETVVDDAPTSGSNNLVRSGGVYTALSAKVNAADVDTTPTQDSQKLITSGAVYDFKQLFLTTVTNDALADAAMADDITVLQGKTTVKTGSITANDETVDGLVDPQISQIGNAVYVSLGAAILNNSTVNELRTVKIGTLNTVGAPGGSTPRSVYMPAVLFAANSVTPHTGCAKIEGNGDVYILRESGTYTEAYIQGVYLTS